MTTSCFYPSFFRYIKTTSLFEVKKELRTWGNEGKGGGGGAHTHFVSINQRQIVSWRDALDAEEKKRDFALQTVATWAEEEMIGAGDIYVNTRWTVSAVGNLRIISTPMIKAGLPHIIDLKSTTAGNPPQQTENEIRPCTESVSMGGIIFFIVRHADAHRVERSEAVRTRRWSWAHTKVSWGIIFPLFSTVVFVDVVFATSFPTTVEKAASCNIHKLFLRCGLRPYHFNIYCSGGGGLAFDGGKAFGTSIT